MPRRPGWRRRTHVVSFETVRSGTVLAAFVFLASPGVASAAPPEAVDFSPRTEILVAGFEDQTYDTGWIPQNSPVQMRFFFHVGNTIVIEMPGEGRYDWGAEAIGFEGTPGAGRFEYDLGVRIEAKVRFDVQGQQWESDLLGPYDWAIESTDAFTPYLLQGNPERPSVVHDETDYVDVASVPLSPNLIVAEGTLDIALKAVVDGELHGRRIEVEDRQVPGAPATVLEEGVFADLSAGPGPGALRTTGRVFCDLRTKADVVVYPHLVFTVLGQDFDIAGVEIPVQVPSVDDEIVLDPVDMDFVERPASEPGDSVGTGGGSGGQGTAGTTTGAASTGGNATGGTEGAGAAAADGGCGCRVPRGRKAPAIAVAFGVLLSLPRRRGSRASRRSTVGRRPRVVSRPQDAAAR